VAPKIAGRIVKITVAAGDAVQAGQVVAELDAAETDVAVAQARGALAAAQARVAQAEQALVLQRTQVDAQLIQARAQVDAATSALAATEAALRAAEANVQAAETGLARAESDQQRLRELSQQGAISAQQLETVESTARAARAQRDAARAQRDAARSQSTAALAALSQARAALAVAEAGRYSVGIREQDVAAVRAQRDQAQAALQLTQITRGYTILQAPMNGVVVAKPAEVGNLVAIGAPVVTIADLNQLYLRVFISEGDLAKVVLGQRAELRVDAYSGRVYSGRVSEISNRAEFTPGNVQTKEERVKLVFAVKIMLMNQDGTLKPGLPADAVILIGSTNGS
jgi:HlyD family secretion protein